jgi:hypothetical protein
VNPPKEIDELSWARRRHPAWVIVCNQDGTYTARRDRHGNQQIITVPTVAELDAILQYHSRPAR